MARHDGSVGRGCGRAGRDGAGAPLISGGRSVTPPTPHPRRWRRRPGRPGGSGEALASAADAAAATAVAAAFSTASAAASCTGCGRALDGQGVREGGPGGGGALLLRRLAASVVGAGRGRRLPLVVRTTRLPGQPVAPTVDGPTMVLAMRGGGIGGGVTASQPSGFAKARPSWAAAVGASAEGYKDDRIAVHVPPAPLGAHANAANYPLRHSYTPNLRLREVHG